MPVQIVRPRNIGAASGGPMIPFDPGGPIDFIPVDVAAAAIGCVVENWQAKPSSWAQLVALGAKPLPDQRESLRNRMRHRVAQRGDGLAQTGTEKAA